MIGNYHVQFLIEKNKNFFTFFQLMQLGWKSFLPLVLGLVLLSTGLLVFFDALPNDLYFF
jgi:NADH:ubiquinone oxidoreductase subunit H